MRQLYRALLMRVYQFFGNVCGIIFRLDAQFKTQRLTQADVSLIGT